MCPVVSFQPTNLVIVVEDESLVVDEDAVEQKPDEEEDDGHGPHRPERCLQVLAMPRPERDKGQHNDPEDDKLVLRLDRHVCARARSKLAVFSPTPGGYFSLQK